MSTPAFTAQDQATLVPIRFYTPFDPYFYTVDNRPLQDISTNLQNMGSVGIDSARRAALLTQLSLSRVYSRLFSSTSGTGYADGLDVTLTGSVLRIGAGSLYVMDVANDAINTQIIKQGIHLGPTSFTLTQPNSVTGDAKDYLVQVKYRALTQESMADSALPFVDPSNPQLPCLLLNGDLIVSIKEGFSSPGGTQVTPAADAGFIPLYRVTTYLAGAPTIISMATGSPDVRKGFTSHMPSTPPTLGPNITTTVQIPFNLKAGNFNPLLPIKLSVLYSSSLGGGNVVFDFLYRQLKLGSTTNITYVTSGEQVTAAPSTANTVAMYTTTTSVIYPNEFAKFIDNTWQADNEVMQLAVARLGGDVRDTAPGDVSIIELRAFQ